MSNANDLIQQVQEGMDVYCSDGKKLGEVGDLNLGLATESGATQAVTEERSYFQVRRGFLGLGNDLYIPAEEIQGVTDDRVTLNCTSDPDSLQAWEQPPRTPGTPTTPEDQHAPIIPVAPGRAAPGASGTMGPST
ncbi:MAG: DUF2171 domain-containing protein [Chloroflexota bacterium]|nr:DUF2171 domain-containing protein [Chloroflexota bacterium]